MITLVYVGREIPNATSGQKISAEKMIQATRPAGLGALPKSLEEKKADLKMEGTYYADLHFELMHILFQLIDRNLMILWITFIKFLDIKHAKETMNTALYVSFVPVLMLYFCCTCKKVSYAISILIS